MNLAQPFQGWDQIDLYLLRRISDAMKTMLTNFSPSAGSNACSAYVVKRC
jgi:hypothetical protein